MNVMLIDATGLVVNCISADSVERAQQFYPEFTCIEQIGAEGPGWTYANGQFVEPPAPTPYMLDMSVSPRQIRQAMTATGIRASVESFVAQADQNTKDWWEFATSFDRQSPVLIQAATALGQTSDQLDALFTLAGSL